MNNYAALELLAQSKTYTQDIVEKLLIDHYGPGHIPTEFFVESPRPAPLARSFVEREINRGFCIMRTRGTRLELLSEALASVASQSIPVTCCLVIHAERQVFSQISRWASALDQDLILLHADRLDKMRGYPINVALDYLRCHYTEYDFFFFLDDDDILYPLYVERLVRTLALSNADIAVGLANQRVPWDAPELVHRALPASALVAGNFIPINSYIACTDILLKSGARMREDMDYLEDWDFLLSLFAFGASFQYLPEVLCEYRIIGDGNQETRRNPQHYEECNDRVKVRGLSAARKLGRRRFACDLSSFNFREPEARDSEFTHIKMALSVFDSVTESGVE